MSRLLCLKSHLRRSAHAETEYQRMEIPPPLNPHHEDVGEIPCPSMKRQKTYHLADLSTARDRYTVAWICALPIEMAAARAVLDEIHDPLPTYPNDHNTYVLGSISGHNVAIACLPSNQYGIVNAATVVTNLTRTFTSIRTGLMVGIGGGVPSKVDLRLGDVVVGTRVMQPDLGKIVGNGELERTAIPRIPHQSLSTAVSALRAIHEIDGSQVPSIIQQRLEGCGYGRPKLPDRLFQATYNHESAADCEMCDQAKLVVRSTRTSKDPLIHYGAIASGSQVIKDSVSRDQVARQLNVICFEMEAAGLMDVLPCLPIRGICDYCDSHKSKEWQRYAAATAAAYAKELLGVIPRTETHAREATTPTSDTDPMSSREKKQRLLLDSLKFEQIDVRKSSIKNAHAKTCQWILTHSDYKSWLDPKKLSEHHGFLWIRGKPGAGKSTIMKFVYSRMREQRKPKIAIASFFFNARGDYLERSVVGMYRSLLLQLLECYPDLQTVLDHYEAPSAQRQNSLHSLNALKELLREATSKLGQRHFTCFIDALDECDEQQVLDMIQFFEDIAERSTVQQTPLRICFSSRHYPYIMIRWGARIVLEDQKGHTDDLEAYVSSTLRSQESEVIEKLLDKASGVFMWVALVVELLNKEYARGAMFIQQRLEELPSNLSDLFRNIIRRDNENMDELLLCFLWILCAERPLQPEEFYHALWSGLLPQTGGDIQFPDASFKDACDNLPRAHRYVISSSKGLAEVTGSVSKKKTVQFIHESVRDFLIKDRGLYELWPELGLDWEGPSHERLKHCCSVYLTQAYKRGSISRLTKNPNCEMRDFGDKRNLNKLQFLEYACQNIFYHANAASHAFSQDEFLSSFNLSDWIGVHNLFEKYGVRCYTTEASLVYVLADKGHPELIRVLLRRKPEIHVEGERYSYPLFAALARGDKASVAALLNLSSTIYEGIDVTEGLDKRKDLEGYKEKTPLSWAIENKRTGIAKLLIIRGQDDLDNPLYLNSYLLEATKSFDETIVSLLLERGANPDFQVNQVTLLESAIDSRHGVLAKLLVDHGANVHGSNSHGQTPLHIASEVGDETIVRILLGEKVNANKVDHLGQTPLHKASKWGNETTVKLLLEYGSDVTVSDIYGLTPLHKASSQYEKIIVKLLLDYGSDVNAVNSFGQTALHIASVQSTEVIIKLLLDYGSNINASDNNGLTPLCIASDRCDEAIVKLLLDYEPDINEPDNYGWTPLHNAAKRGPAAIVRLLLDHRPDVNIPSNDGRIPLHLVSIRNIEAIVELLLDYGSDPNFPDHSGQTPLHKASEQSTEDIVKVLLDYESDPNVPDNLGQTPLHKASEQGQKPIAKLLLDYGSDPNVPDHSGHTSLHKASQHINEPIVRLLLERGSDPNATNRFGQTPLHMASRLGYGPIVELLLEHGSYVDHLDSLGTAPLGVALCYGMQATADLLLIHGANPQLTEFTQAWEWPLDSSAATLTDGDIGIII